MKENKLIEMSNKIDTMGSVLNRIVQELNTMKDISVGTTELLKLIDWTDIPDKERDCMLTLCQQIVGLRNKGQVDYVFSPRDIDQFCDVYRTYLIKSKKWDFKDVLNNVILIKYNDSQEREQVRIRINETFGVDI